MRRLHSIATLLFLLFALAPAARADLLEGFRDKEDQQIDLSDWLLDRKGVLPVPLFITEPAVGYGGGLVGLFFRESVRERAQKARESGRMEPPDIYALGGLGTENGTRAGFAGGMVTTEDGSWRWRGGVAKIDANLDFYGIGGGLGPLRYGLKGLASVQHAMMRLGDSDNWLVARWNFMDLDNEFGNPDGRLGGIVRSSRSSGLGISLETDTRDTIFTPSRGWTGALDATFYAPGIGSDTTFQTYRGHAFGYWPLGKSFVLGGRADARSSAGDVPFYLLPYVDLRGVPAMRLQDQSTAVLETELRWNVTPRWAVVGFVGGGRAWGTDTSFSEGTSTFSKGFGFRYLLARRMGLYAGVDWAWSTQDQAWYIQVGTAWR